MTYDCSGCQIDSIMDDSILGICNGSQPISSLIEALVVSDTTSVSQSYSEGVRGL